jgi:superfamily II DNA helicase RecQ
MTFDTNRAIELLRLGSGLPHADFLAGQEEAIRHVVEGRGRLLVVQNTGWGKSFVYFIATKLLRAAGAGPVLLTPLLALMRSRSQQQSGWACGRLPSTPIIKTSGQMSGSDATQRWTSC